MRFPSQQEQWGGGMELLRPVYRLNCVLACLRGANRRAFNVAKVVMEAEGLEYGNTLKLKNKG
jgi:hypothetical protein